MFKRILAAIDGSDHSMKAAEAAIDLAHVYASDLTLLHVTRKLELPDQLKEYLNRSTSVERTFRGSTRRPSASSTTSG